MLAGVCRALRGRFNVDLAALVAMIKGNQVIDLMGEGEAELHEID